jgi:hypothetical protein
MERIPLATKEVPAEVDRYRRAMGFLLGLLLGFVYSLISQGINQIFLPGVPLYQPPFGFWGNIGLSALWGGVLGLICAWPYSTAIGVTLASTASILVTVIRGLAGIDEPVSRLVIIAAVLGVPAAFLMVPAMMALRWAVNGQVDMRGRPASLSGRLRGPLTLLAIMAVIAVFALYNSKARMVLTRMDEMLQAGLAAVDAAGLPEALAAPRTGDFLGRADATYTLEWTEQDLDRFIDLRPSNNFSEHSAVIARFANGQTLICLYPSALTRPNCSFRAVPRAIPVGPRFSPDA